MNNRSKTDAILTNNTCNNNNGDGISLLYCDYGSILTNNTCTNNNLRGIYLWLSVSCLLSYNLLQENEGYGIDILVSDNNIIHHNIFVDNNLDGTSQAYDKGKNNKWYDTETNQGNWWSDLGNECKYKIASNAHSKDIYPLNRDQSCPNPVIISTISIVIPVLVSLAILAFIVPKFGVPYANKRKAERYIRIAKMSEEDKKKREKILNRRIILSVVGLIGFVPSLSLTIWVVATGEIWIGFLLFITVPFLLIFSVILLATIPKLIYSIRGARIEKTILKKEELDLKD